MEKYLAESAGHELSEIHSRQKRQVQTNDFYCRYEGEMGIMCYCRSNNRYIPVNSTQCDDVNECSINNGGCMDRCVNTEGSYFCECTSAGLVLSADRHECRDVNECTLGTATCPASECVNTWGGYFCRTAGTTQPTCTSRTDIVFAIDSSGSINQNNAQNWNIMLSFFNNVISRLNVGLDRTHIGIVVYSNNAVVQRSVGDLAGSSTDNAYLQAVLNTVSNLGYVGGTTNIADGFEKSRLDLQSAGRSNANKIIVLVTDGIANEREGETIIEAQRAKAIPATILTLGITNQINEQELRDIASSPDKYIKVSDFDALDNVVSNLVDNACGNSGRSAALVDTAIIAGSNVGSVVGGMQTTTMIAVVTALSVLNLVILVVLSVRCMRTIRQKRAMRGCDNKAARFDGSAGTISSFNSLSSKFGASPYSSEDAMSTVSSMT